jgi:YVTN family beta-propeller protein
MTRRALSCTAVVATAAAVILPLSGAAAVPSASPHPVSLLHTYHLRFIGASEDDPEGSEPFTAAVDPRHHWAYVGNLDGLSTTVINTRGGVPTELAVPGIAGSIAADARTGLAYVPDAVDSQTCATVLRGTTRVTTITAPNCNGVLDATVNPRTGLVYLDNTGTTEMVVIRGRRVVGSFRAGSNAGPGAANPRSGLVYIPNRDSNSVSVIKGRRVVSTIKLSGEPGAVAVDPTRNLAYVTGPNAGKVWVIRGRSARGIRAVTAEVGFGNGIAVNPLTHLAYVAGPDTLSVLKGAKLRAAITLSDDPAQPVVDPANGLAFVVGNDNFIDVIRGTRLIQTVPGTPEQPTSAAIDTSNGRLVVSDGGAPDLGCCRARLRRQSPSPSRRSLRPIDRVRASTCRSAVSPGYAIRSDHVEAAGRQDSGWRPAASGNIASRCGFVRRTGRRS